MTYQEFTKRFAFISKCGDDLKLVPHGEIVEVWNKATQFGQDEEFEKIKITQANYKQYLDLEILARG